MKVRPKQSITYTLVWETTSEQVRLAEKGNSGSDRSKPAYAVGQSYLNCFRSVSQFASYRPKGGNLSSM
jgi:hypothetical protein